jgi:DNA primase
VLEKIAGTIDYPVYVVDQGINWSDIPDNNVGFFGRFKFVIPDSALDPFMKDQCDYLNGRGFTKESIAQWEIGFDRDKERVIFPVRNIDNELVGVSGRAIRESRIKYLHYHYDKSLRKFIPYIDRDRKNDMIKLPKSKVLFGEDKVSRLDRSFNDLIIAEGFTDVIWLWQNGFVSVGVLGSFPSNVQLEMMVRLLPRDGRLVLMLDSDDAGRKCRDRIKKELDMRVKIYAVNLPDGKDPADMSRDVLKEHIKNASL